LHATCGLNGEHQVTTYFKDRNSTRSLAMIKKSKIRGRYLPMTLAVVMIIGGWAWTAQADPLVAGGPIPAKQQAAAAAYWTREKIAAAPAMKMPVDRGAAVVDTAALVDEVFLGPEEMAPAGMPDPDADRIARKAYPRDWRVPSNAQVLEEIMAPDAAADIDAGTSATYTYYDVNTQTALWNILPHRWSGKLTFNTPSGTSSCSATVISGNNIVTAAHCLYDSTNNVWYSNWVFTPAYRNGSAPYGTFPATAKWILTAWINLTGSYSINTWARHDVAIIKLGNNSSGQSINSAVGWAGRLWNSGYAKLNFNSGYPARTYTDATITNGPAQYLRSCTNESFQQTTETLGGGCFWGRGISGGSWLIGYKPFVASGQVNSVNSGLFINQQNLYGARFNSSNIVPLCTAAGC
jgi:V8-like Glu-specific endopeptidase